MIIVSQKKVFQSTDSYLIAKVHPLKKKLLLPCVMRKMSCVVLEYFPFVSWERLVVSCWSIFHFPLNRALLSLLKLARANYVADLEYEK